MAAGVAELMGATATIGLTGAAGPDPLDGAEPGTVVVATYVDGAVDVHMHRLEGDPTDVCTQARDLALVALSTARAPGTAPMSSSPTDDEGSSAINRRPRSHGAGSTGS